MKNIVRIAAVLAMACSLCGAELRDSNSSWSARDYSPGYSSPGFDHGYEHGAPLDKWPYPSTSIIESTCHGGHMWLKVGLVALIAFAVLKLPLLFALKLLLLKLSLPFGLMLAAAPVAIPLLYMLLPNRGGSDSGSGSTTPATPMSRSFPDPLLAFLRDPDCLETIACGIGTSHADTAYDKPIGWLLKKAESFLGGSVNSRSRVESYRVAYLEGARSRGKACPKYKCRMPQLVLKQGEASFPVKF